MARLRASTAPKSAGEVALGAKRRVTEGAQGGVRGGRLWRIADARAIC